ncbi:MULTISPECIES: AraC family transcriptional regulator [unclassified Photobacterium]|uniref:helix-turn-helix domain-containing protein n=1 Tax=unclassified Photobacterium TaxID=2628852 RepID=UPI001EDE0327|nr:MULTISPECIES: AraC family transcriptional regulator [unclassified Photobacterium]MCG3865151.1 helix-turn-helix transcriptional regulator [Photobacterium sp. Ph6]MCG3876559.1 helix-turn-helix transcriptional regulator [Photobacterium sp. Ph5]
MEVKSQLSSLKNTVSSGWKSVIPFANFSIEDNHTFDMTHFEGLWLKQYLSTITPEYHALSTQITKIAQSVNPLTFNFYSLALWTSPDRYTQLHTLCHYSALLNSSIRFHLDENKGGNINLWLLSNEPIAKHSTESLSLLALHFALLLNVIKQTWGTKTLKGDAYLPSLTNLRIEQQLFDNLIASSALNIKCHYGFPLIRLTFSKKSLSLPLTDSDPVINQNSLWQLKHQLVNYHQNNVIHQVYRALKSLPDLDAASGNHIASLMDISFRTLNRRLACLSTSYRGVLENYKLEMALSLLDDSELGLTDIAQQLGFSDLSTFSRAFKRWTGLCPSQLTSKNQTIAPRVVSHWELI